MIKQDAIYIPSRGRWEKLLTPYALPAPLRKRCIVVVRQDEVRRYMIAHAKRDFDLAILPKHVNGLSATRQWILDQSGDDVLIMLDDDITGINLKADPTKYGGVVKVDNRYFTNCFNLMYRWIDAGFVHVSFADRFVAARPSKNDYYENGRIAQALFYERSVLVNNHIRFDRVPLMQDLDVNLQLLGLGYKNRVSTNYSFNSRWYGSPGGCEAYRTTELHDHVGRRMEKLHPGITKLVPKPKGGGMTMRTKWREAYRAKAECI